MRKVIDGVSSAATLLLSALISELPIILLCYLVALMPITYSGIFAYGKVWFALWAFPQPFIISVLVGLLAHWKKWIFHTLSVLIIFIFAAELFCYLCQGTRITSAIVIIVLQSNPAEAGEYLTGGAHVLRNAIITIVLASILLIAINWGTRLWQNSKVCHRLHEFFGGHRILTILTAAIIVFLSYLSIYAINKVLHRDYAAYWQRLGNRHCVITPITIWKAWDDAIFEASRIDLDRIQEAIDNIRIEQVEHEDSLTVIFVVGESHIKHRTSSYGYFQNTYPKIDSLISRGEITLFNNVIAVSNRTRDVFPRLMSTYLVGDTMSEISNAPLLPAVMKKAGYDVSLYSNQSLVKTSTSFDFGCYYILGRNSIVESSFDNLNTETMPYDDMMIRKYPPMASGKSNFLIYHLMGQHSPSANRIPDWWKREFTTDEYSDLEHFDDQQYENMAAYDNACQYNDYVISEIIAGVSDRNAIVVYTTDHGEEFYDWRNQAGRILDCYLPGTIKTVYEVPLFIWLSPKYSESHPELAETLRANADKPIYNSDIAHTIMDLAGIRSNALRPEMSLLNPNVPEIRKNRKIGLTLTANYDSLRETIKNTPLIYEFKSTKQSAK